MTWALALGNLATIEKDKRHVCKQCGSKYEVSKFARKTMYCTVECRQEANLQMKKAKRKNYKPLESCTTDHQRIVNRKKYWMEVFGNAA